MVGRADLDGRVALVSGGTKQSGEAVASRLAGLGAAVVVCGRSQEAGERVAGRIVTLGGTAVFTRTDLLVESDVQAAVQRALDCFGRLDIVVNNAAAIDDVRSGVGDAAVVESTTSVVERMMRVGFMGPLWFYKYAIPGMVNRGGGAFVSVSSTSAVMAFPGIPAYTASKAALEALSRQVAADYGHRGIRCNVVRLGSMVVAANAELHSLPDYDAAARSRVMVPRLGRPSDLADAVAFLVGDGAGYINGQVLSVDGGATVFSSSPSVSAAWHST